MKSLLRNISKKLGAYSTLSQLQLVFKFAYNQLVNRYFNRLAIAQEKNVLSIPIIIISFNQLTYLKQLIDYLLSSGFRNIIIIDNNSTYKPLLDYFNEIKSVVAIKRLKKNYGHKVFWEVPEVYKKYAGGYYVVTDPDILPLHENAENFMNLFIKILNTNSKATKVGLSLKIDDIPNTNKNKLKIIEWETQWWLKPLSAELYEANIDTTFAMYRPKYHAKDGRFLSGIRTASPYIAKHLSWYIDTDNLSKETQFFMNSCNASSSWRLSTDGTLKDKRYD
ncbi:MULTISPECIES: glycosyltransferase family A protein [unclassified Winogradskyella]|uniref:glycosyltransferase family A protein n=1 Tax=unclassified Winogradskyella TaxID=2615021 RepID=UPI000B3C6E48|nr:MULTISPECIES: glycosyltransferase family A protein [unclassified Winogradskyella]